MTLKEKRIILCVTSWCLRILPLLILFICKWNTWIVRTEGNVASQVSLTIGGIMCACFAGLAVADKLPKPNNIMFPCFFFVILICLKSILNDLILILGMYILGSVLSMIVDLFIKETKRKEVIQEGSQANASEMRSILTELLGDKSGT